MKRMLVSGLLAVVLGGGVAQAADISIGAVITGEVLPGVYGRVEIGTAPPPLVFPKPMIIAAKPRRTPLEPVYLHVPPGHARNWSKYCGRYNACSRPVYFVKSAEYEPGYRRDEGRDQGRDDDRGNPGKGNKRKSH